MRETIKLSTIGLIIIMLIPLRLWANKFVFTTSWTAQAEFAGYYVAKEKGFYREAGLDVTTQYFYQPIICVFLFKQGFPCGPSSKESACKCRRCKRRGFNPWGRKSL